LALRQITALIFEPHQATMEPRQHRPAETGSFGLAQSRTGCYPPSIKTNIRRRPTLK
jgi:hypothetical protein